MRRILGWVPSLVLFVLFFSVSAEATTASPAASPQVFSATGVEPYTVLSNVVYYSAVDSASVSLDSGSYIDSAAGFRTLNLSQASASDTGLSHAVVLNFYSPHASAAPSATTKILTLAFNSNGEYRRLPLSGSGAGGTTASGCNDSTCYFSHSDSRYYAVRFTPGQVLQVAFHLSDLCEAAYSRYGDVPSGCETNGTVSSTTAKAISFSLRAYLYATNRAVISDPDSLARTEPADASGSAETYDFTVTIHNAAPSLACSANWSTAVSPGDSSIYVPTGEITAYSGASTSAPVNQILVLGSRSPSPETAYDTYTTNPVVARISNTGSDVQVTGFENSTAAENKTYSVSFLALDAAGVVGATSSGCSLTNVSTAEIGGFLNESKCFIATAAYANPRHPDVKLLRRWRDEVLLESTLGRWVVNVYYRHSPAAAEWLLKHPRYRPWALKLLQPVVSTVRHFMEKNP